MSNRFPVVYDKRDKKVYFLVSRFTDELDFGPFVEELNKKEPGRYEVATSTAEPARSERAPKSTNIGKAYEEYIRDHPELRLEVAWSYYRGRYGFGWRNRPYPDPDTSEFGFLGGIGGVEELARQARVSLEEAKAFVRTKMVELVGEDVVAKFATELDPAQAIEVHEFSGKFGEMSLQVGRKYSIVYRLDGKRTDLTAVATYVDRTVAGGLSEGVMFDALPEAETFTLRLDQIRSIGLIGDDVEHYVNRKVPVAGR